MSSEFTMSALLRRGIFHSDDDHKCPALPQPLDDADKLIGNYTLHQFLLLLGAISAALAIVISGLLFTLHAFNLRNPKEQIKIMRIITIIPVYAILSLANIATGQTSVYIDPWSDVYESICVSSFYLLTHVYIAPTLEEQAAFFARLPYKRTPKGPVKGDNSLAFWRRTQIFTFIAIPIQIMLAILTDLTNAEGVYCMNSNKPSFAHIWITILRTLTTSVSVFAVIRMTYRLKPELPQYKLTTQLWAFKLIVGVSSGQAAIFSFVAGDFTPTTKLSYNDVAVGLPNALLNLEMVFFAIFFFKAYSYRRYVPGGAGTITKDGFKQQSTVMNAFSATIRAINPAEVFIALFQILTGKWKVQQGWQGSNSELQLVNQGPTHDETVLLYQHQRQQSTEAKPGPPPPPESAHQWPSQGPGAPWDHESHESLTAYDPYHNDRLPAYMGRDHY